jgi:hypothetical protein
VIADERAAERFTAPSDDVERVLLLRLGRPQLPSGRDGEAAVRRNRDGNAPDTLRGYAEEAGFSEFDVLPIENDFWRFYRLKA